MGGVYNGVNMQLYHYAGNNPVKYTDPDGRVILNQTDTTMPDSDVHLGSGPDTLKNASCTLTMYVRMAQSLGADVTVEQANEYAKKK